MSKLLSSFLGLAMVLGCANRQPALPEVQVASLSLVSLPQSTDHEKSQLHIIPRDKSNVQKVAVNKIDTVKLPLGVYDFMLELHNQAGLFARTIVEREDCKPLRTKLEVGPNPIDVKVCAVSPDDIIAPDVQALANVELTIAIDPRVLGNRLAPPPPSPANPPVPPNSPSPPSPQVPETPDPNAGPEEVLFDTLNRDLIAAAAQITNERKDDLFQALLTKYPRGKRVTIKMTFNKLNDESLLVRHQTTDPLQKPALLAIYECLLNDQDRANPPPINQEVTIVGQIIAIQAEENHQIRFVMIRQP